MLTSQIKKNLFVEARSTRGELYGTHVGTVDHLDGDKYIKLTRKDSPDHRHHWIPVDWVERIEDETVFLNRTTQEFYHGQLNERPPLKKHS